MTKTRWETLLKGLEINTSMGELTPELTQALDDFEKSRSVKLPLSYRSYCEVFGAGEFGRQFKIAVPGYKGDATVYSLEELDQGAHELEYTSYAKDVAQYERSIFFCVDILRSHYFFDPAEASDLRNHEYAVYTLFSDFTVKRTADNFWEFVSDFCLGAKHDQLITDPPATPLFMPVTV